MTPMNSQDISALAVLNAGGPSAFGIYMCSLCTGISLPY